MALPLPQAPTFFATLPSDGREVKFRPFLIKEQKVLLMALQGEDPKEIGNAILQIIKSCIVSDIDVEKLATFDVEYLFLRIRSKSVGEVVQFRIGHQNKDSECTHKQTVSVNLEEVQATGSIRKDNRIMITDDIGVTLRYPSLSDMENNSNLDDLLASCVESIFTAEEVYTDLNVKEVTEWLENLSREQLEKINEFYEEIPRLIYDLTWTCKKCNTEETLRLEGLQSFFTSL